MTRLPRERLNMGRERLEQPKEEHPLGTRFIIKHPTKELYLRRLAYVAMTEEEKWKPLDWADCFLDRDGTAHFARRMLGHNNFTVVVLKKDK